MATYSAIADTEVDAESPITATLMTRLRDNPLAIQEGDASAPSIAMAALASYPFAQADLKTTTGSVSIGTSATVSHATLPGGQYGFEPQISESHGAADEYFVVPGVLSHDTSPWTTGGFEAPDGSAADFPSATAVISLGQENTGTLTATQRYIQSSPPYDLGDGEIPLFVFALMDANGDPSSVWVAPDPPWANNGPTRTAPDFIDPKTRKAYQRRRVMALSLEDVKAGRASMAEYIQARQSAEVQLVEVTQEIKQADMALIPHGWISPRGTPVLLDPVSDLAAALLDLHNDGENIGKLVAEGYVKISNRRRAVNSPPGVSAMHASWKVTRA